MHDICMSTQIAANLDLQRSLCSDIVSSLLTHLHELSRQIYTQPHVANTSAAMSSLSGRKDGMSEDFTVELADELAAAVAVRDKLKKNYP